MRGNTASIAGHLVVAAMLSLLTASNAWSAGDAARGVKVFQACAACHSIAPGVQMTGPSLANVWGRKAGALSGFPRYSEPLKHANIVWNETTLDRWLTNPEALVPGTTMTFPGIPDRQARQDVIAYLHSVSEGKAPQSGGGGMMMNMQSPKEDLRKAPPAGQVIALTHCKDTYTVKTADGKVNKVWEFNLRLKTDSSSMGPQPGKPVIVGNGMQGDRAAVVFASPQEISGYIAERCE